MNLKDPEKEFFNDFEHKVTDKMKKYADRQDFPKVEDYGITRMELDDYLFDKQAILDMAGTPRTKMTVGGIITLLPVIVLSAFPDSAYIYGKMWTTVLAIVVGFMLYMCIYALQKAIIQLRLSKHKDVKYESFNKAVLFYEG